MEENMKLVDFNKWCDSCKHKNVKETDEPCDSCLEVPARQYSTKPEKYEHHSSFGRN